MKQLWRMWVCNRRRLIGRSRSSFVPYNLPYFFNFFALPVKLHPSARVLGLATLVYCLTSLLSN